MKRILLVTAIAALAPACGRSGGDAATIATHDPPARTPGPILGGDDGGDVPPGDPALPCNGLVTLRLRGVNPGEVTVFHLDLASVSLSAGGTSLPIHGGARGTMDLLADHAVRLAIAPVPRGETSIRATVAFAGGHAVAAGGEVAFDACNLPLTFTIVPAKVNPASCHAVVHLDLAGSVAAVAGAGGTAFVPRFSLHY